MVMKALVLQTQIKLSDSLKQSFNMFIIYVSCTWLYAQKNLKVNELGEMEGRAEMIFKLNE